MRPLRVLCACFVRSLRVLCACFVRPLRVLCACFVRSLRFQYDDHDSFYQELLRRSSRYFMDFSRLRDLCVEIYKTMKKLNSPFMQQLFHFKSSMNMNHSMRIPYELQHYKQGRS